MYRAAKFGALVLLGTLAGCQQLPVPALPDREETPIGGPERVFTRPVAEFVPLLRGARRAGPAGRVGPELVFWGFELADRRQAFLVACAVLPDVDCLARVPKVCESGQPDILSRQEDQGAVRYLDCQEVGIVAPGDLTPNCAEDQEVQAVEVTLLSCP